MEGRAIPEEKTPMIKSIEMVGIESGKKMKNKNHNITVELDNLVDKIDIDDDFITLDSNLNWVSLENAGMTIDLETELDNISLNAFSDVHDAVLPNDPLAIVCDLKNKQYTNREIVSLFERFLSAGVTVNCHTASGEIETPILKSFYNPSDAAKERAGDIKNHFETKFTMAALKSENGDLSNTRKQILTILQNDYTVSSGTPISLPILVTIPDFYDEDLKLTHLQSVARHQKSDYKTVENAEYPIAKTLYPLLYTVRNTYDRLNSSYSGYNYFWKDSDGLLYRINSSKRNELRPFLEYFFTRESVDLVIYNQKRDKIPSIELFFYDMKDFRLADIIEV